MLTYFNGAKKKIGNSLERRLRFNPLKLFIIFESLASWRQIDKQATGRAVGPRVRSRADQIGPGLAHIKIPGPELFL